MSKTLPEIAQQLIDTNKKVQLIYGFNGTGKTRLSLALKKLISPKTIDDFEILDEIKETDEISNTRRKFLYYNAHTEDLFYWDNDLELDDEPKLKIQPNSFTDWLIKLLKDLGQDRNIITHFQHYTSDKITPKINEEYKYKSKDSNGKEIEVTVPAFSEVNFTISETLQVTHNGDNVTHNGKNVVITNKYENVKISKGEESNFIWSIFYALLDQVITILNEPDRTNRETDEFDQLEYVFIDDPVSSLDDNHLIELAVSLAKSIKSSAYKDNKGLKFIITTHNPLFYNVLYNEFSNDLTGKMSDGSTGKIYKEAQSEKYILKKYADGTFQLINSGVNDRPFSYHLFLLAELRKIEDTTKVEKFHFNFLRNILEKTSTFLGYKHWNKLLDKLPEADRTVMERMLNLYSHSAHAGEEISDIKDEHKEKLIELVKFLTKTYGFMEERS